jgi:hypothetical protein
MALRWKIGGRKIGRHVRAGAILNAPRRYVLASLVDQAMSLVIDVRPPAARPPPPERDCEQNAVTTTARRRVGSGPR